MRGFGFSLLMAAVLGLVFGPAPARAAGFETGLEGWTTVGFDVDAGLGGLNSITLVSTDGDMVWSQTGGQGGGGFAELVDAIESPASFALAPEDFLPTDLTGQTLEFSYQLFDNGLDDNGLPAEIFPLSVILISGDPTDLNAVVWVGPTLSNPPTGWLDFSLTVDETDFIKIEDLNLSLLGPEFPDITPAEIPPFLGGPLTGDMTFGEIVANVTDVLYPFEISNNTGNQMSESAGLDLPMGMVPEPTSWALLLLVGAALRLRRP